MSQQKTLTRRWSAMVVAAGIGLVSIGHAGAAVADSAPGASGLDTQSAAASSLVAGGVIFEDDFSGAAGSLPDAAKWDDYSTCTYNGSAAFGSIQCGNNETLDGAGHLVVPATPTAGSAIRTGAKFTFQYGVMSAWIKTPAQVGYWPAFWSLNNNPNGVDALPVGEVDALEGYTTWDDVYHATSHNWSGSEATSYHDADNYCGQGTSLSAGYHKYSARIEPGKITYYFDDQQCGQAHTPSTDPTKVWAFGPDVTRGNWLILNLAVGGAGGQQQPATQNAQMLVDRVEVRSLG